jgi:hypothetical protein
MPSRRHFHPPQSELRAFVPLVTFVEAVGACSVVTSGQSELIAAGTVFLSRSMRSRVSMREGD